MNRKVRELRKVGGKEARRHGDTREGGGGDGKREGAVNTERN